jgi:hypothetical protein
VRSLLLVLAACASSPRPVDPALPAPHRGPIATTPLRSPVDLQRRIGARDKRDPIEAVLGWAGELGLRVPAESSHDLLAWAERTHRLRDAGEPPRPGDLLVFAHDMVAIAIARDARGVTEIVYLAGGVVRRGFVDATRPRMRRDRGGAIVNTYLRHGKRNARGTRHLAGELLSAVIRMR